MNRLAIFDCDGTLVDSQHNICRAMEDCFAAAGLAPPPRERTRGVVGLSLVEAMRAMLPDADAGFHAALAEDYKRAFQAMREVNEQYEAKFTVLIENVEHHIEEEEKEMLPDAQKTLGDETKALGDRMEERKPALMAAAR